MGLSVIFKYHSAVPSPEFKGERCIVEPRDLLGQSVPGDRAEDGIMRSSRIVDEKSAFLDPNLAFSFHKVTIELWGVTSFEAP